MAMPPSRRPSVTLVPSRTPSLTLTELMPKKGGGALGERVIPSAQKVMNNWF